jgi:hypothetical protein
MRNTSKYIQESCNQGKEPSILHGFNSSIESVLSESRPLLPPTSRRVDCIPSTAMPRENLCVSLIIEAECLFSFIERKITPELLIQVSQETVMALGFPADETVPRIHTGFEYRRRERRCFSTVMNSTIFFADTETGIDSGNEYSKVIVLNYKCREE